MLPIHKSFSLKKQI